MIDRRLLGLASLILIATLVPAQGPSPEPAPKDVMKIVSLFLEKAHLIERGLDDEISLRAFDHFIDGLDARKLYFYQSDIDGFRKRSRAIDDMMQRGDPGFAELVLTRFQTRVNERVEMVERILGTELDFDEDEVFVTDPEAASYAKSPEEAFARWRRRVKLDLLSLESDDVTGEEAITQLKKRYERFRDRMSQETANDVAYRLVNAVTTSFDPHSIYFAPKPFEDFEMGLTLNYQGIGAHLAEAEEGVTVSKLVPGGAAEKAGDLKAGDLIVGVGQGHDGPLVEIVGMRVSDVVKHIRGKQDTVVRLGVVPAAGGPKRIYTIVRARIKLEESVAESRVYEHGQTPDGRAYKIGVIDLPSFYRDSEAVKTDQFRSSTHDVRRMLGEFKQQGVDACILDLRRNGGGFLPEAVNLTGLFIDTGPVVQVKSGPRVRILRDEEAGTAWEGPLVVLTSRASASASEILAGAVKDYGRGLVVGDSSTHGKGTVQTTIDLAGQVEHPSGPGSLGVLKLTIQQFYRPDGLSTQLQGVPSDVTIPSWMEILDEGEAALDYPVSGDSITGVGHDRLGLVTPEVVKTLRDASASRVAASVHFKNLAAQITAYKIADTRKSVTVNRAAYQALVKELEAHQEELKAAIGAEKPDPTTDAKDAPPPPNAWFTEILDITSDYLNLSVPAR